MQCLGRCRKALVYIDRSGALYCATHGAAEKQRTGNFLSKIDGVGSVTPATSYFCVFTDDGRGGDSVYWPEEPNDNGFVPIGVAGKKFLTFVTVAKKIITKNNSHEYARVLAINNGEAYATDGFRLIWGDVGLSVEGCVCIPQPALAPLLKILKKEKTLDVWLNQKEAMVAFIGDSARLYVRLNDVAYPNVQHAIPDTNRNGVIEVSLEDVAKAKATVLKEGEPVSIGGHAFNPRFLAEMPEGEKYVIADEMLMSFGEIRFLLCSQNQKGRIS